MHPLVQSINDSNFEIAFSHEEVLINNCQFCSCCERIKIATLQKILKPRPFAGLTSKFLCLDATYDFG